MAAKTWLIGFGSLVGVGVLVAVIGGTYLVKQVGTVRQDIEDANRNYADANRDFPFKQPVSGELNEERFVRYIRVRTALEVAVAPVQANRGLKRLAALAALPGEASHAHIQALREQSMSLEEYDWISRQIYTTLVAESHQPNPDPDLANLAREYESAFRRRGGIRVGSDSSSDSNPFAVGVIDLAWLRVPQKTREIVRAYAAELAKTANTIVADQLLLQIQPQ